MFCALLIVNVCARRLGSRAGPEHAVCGNDAWKLVALVGGKGGVRAGGGGRGGGEQQGFVHFEPSLCRSRQQAGPSTASVCSCSKRSGWVTGKETGSRSAQTFSAGSRGELSVHLNRHNAMCIAPHGSETVGFECKQPTEQLSEARCQVFSRCRLAAFIPSTIYSSTQRVPKGPSPCPATAGQLPS